MPSIYDSLHWITYNGNPETLPEEDIVVGINIDNKLMTGIFFYEEINSDEFDYVLEPYWSIPFEYGDFMPIYIGDRWCYFPENEN